MTLGSRRERQPFMSAELAWPPLARGQLARQPFTSTHGRLLQVVESLASHGKVPTAFAANGAGPDALIFVHMLRRCEGGACTELVRARTTWRTGEDR